MPFFDANKLLITVDFDDNIVVTGSCIRGVVNIFALESLTVCGASLRFKIIEGGSEHYHERGSVKATADGYCIEYILFGHRSSRKGEVVKVSPGHFSYPFSIPVPHGAPPSSDFGEGRGHEGHSGTMHEVRIRVDHVIEVEVYIAHSLMDKSTKHIVPMTVRCINPSVLASTTNGFEAKLRDGMSISRGIFSSKPTKEQANCDIFFYNTAVSLAETLFLQFAIRGKINCPYTVCLIRDQRFIGSRIFSREEIVSSLTMPPLDSTDTGVVGKLMINPHALQNSTSMQGKHVHCSFYVTLKLVYTDDSSACIRENDRIRIPITIVHGSLAEDVTAASAMEVGIVDGAVMAYSPPPPSAPNGQGRANGGGGNDADFAPVGPVTESAAQAQWGHVGAQMLRPGDAAPTISAAGAAVGVVVHTEKGAAPLPPGFAPPPNKE